MSSEQTQAGTVRPPERGVDRHARILLVEDERKVAEALREGLAGEGFDVVHEGSGQGAFFRAVTETFDVLLLDLTLPDRDGLQILAALRARDVRTLVLIMSARDAVEERIRGLDEGADDYLVKPFAFAELLARVRALLRRGPAEGLRMTVGDLTLDPLTRQAVRGGRPLELTLREFQLLSHLMQHAHQVVSRESLTRNVWKETARTSPLDNVIDVHIARLRKKIDAEPAVPLIHTVRGVGFLLSENAP